MGAELVGKLTESVPVVGQRVDVASGPTTYALSVAFPAATPALFKNTRAQFALEFPSTRVDIAGQGSAIALSGVSAATVQRVVERYLGAITWAK